MEKPIRMKLSLVFVFATVYMSGFSQDITVEDSIRSHYKFDDSLKVIGTYYYSHGPGMNMHARTFIDYNKNSIFHKRIISNYGCNCSEERLYNSMYNESIKKFADSISTDKKLISKIKGHWIPIRKYKSEFYFYYVSCEFNSKGFTISDSTLVRYYMDGPFPSLILNVKKENNDIAINTDRGQFKLYRLANSNIYVCVNGREKEYLIHEENLNEYPIISIDCHEVGASEPQFDKITEY